MKLEEAKEISGEFIREISDIVSSIKICGSIRREQPYPRDIDIVLIPENPLMFKVDFVKRFKKSIKQIGNKLIRLDYKGEQIDVYLANKQNFGTLKLIRTGSRFFNIKMCQRARRLGMKLSASDGIIKNGKIIASKTEEDIFNALDLKYIEPRKRDKYANI